MTHDIHGWLGMNADRSRDRQRLVRLLSLVLFAMLFFRVGVSQNREREGILLSAEAQRQQQAAAPGGSTDRKRP